MSAFTSAAVVTPLMLGAAGVFVFVLTSWMDRRDKAAADRGP